MTPNLVLEKTPRYSVYHVAGHFTPCGGLMNGASGAREANLSVQYTSRAMFSRPEGLGSGSAMTPVPAG